MTLLPHALEKVPHTYFDSFCIPKRSPAPKRLILFQRSVGSLALDNCSRCGALIEGARQRTSLETNMELSGQIPSPRIFVVQRFTIDFKFPVIGDLREAFGNLYRLEFEVDGRTAFICSVKTLLEYHPPAAPVSIIVNAGEYFAPQLAQAEEECSPPTFTEDIYGYVRVHGALFLEVG